MYMEKPLNMTSSRKADREYVIVLSDWIDEDPHEVMRTLKRGSDYYMLKRGAMRSIYGAFQKGALADVFKRSLDRMPPMDISDVGYDLFLINGQKELSLPAKPGEDILLRIINAAAGIIFLPSVCRRQYGSCFSRRTGCGAS